MKEGKGTHRPGFRTWFHSFLALSPLMKPCDFSVQLPLIFAGPGRDANRGSGTLGCAVPPHPTSPRRATRAHKVPQPPAQELCSFVFFKGTQHWKARFKCQMIQLLGVLYRNPAISSSLPKHNSTPNQGPHGHAWEYRTHMSKLHPHLLQTDAPQPPEGHTYWHKGRGEIMPTQVLEVDLGHLSKRCQGSGRPKRGPKGGMRGVPWWSSG